MIYDGDSNLRKLRLYLETSIWNFYFADDSPEKRDITQEFFENAKQGKYNIFISQAVLDEVDRADEPKRSQLMQLIKECDPQVLNIT